MANHARFAEVAQLAGDPARVAMLHALMDGRALTAKELAAAAGITAQTASGHLAKLTDAGFLAVDQQGRHRYHRITSPAVAQMLESIMQVASEVQSRRPAPVTGPRDKALRYARTCYDHLAGSLGVALADALVSQGHIELSFEAGLVTDSGVALFESLGISLPTLNSVSSRSGRMLCRPCLDWSERRPHLAGAIGAALCSHCFERGWIRRVSGSRAVSVTPAGQLGFGRSLGVTLQLA